ASGGSGTEATTDPAELGPPVIADMTLTPNPIKSAGLVTVEVAVEDEGAEVVTITVDGGEPAELTLDDAGGTLFTGEIAVFGESWNGDHEVVAIAARGGEVSEPRTAWFTVEAPAAGSEAWLEKSPLVPSLGNAVDVDDQGPARALVGVIEVCPESEAVRHQSQTEVAQGELETLLGYLDPAASVPLL